VASNQGNQAEQDMSGGSSGQQRGGETSAREQRRDDQGQFAGTDGSQRDQGSGSSNRRIAGMDDEQQRDIAQRGGETSSREQRRDDEARFSGTDGRSSSSQGGGTPNQGGSQGGKQSTTNR
jgi:hypothetical protein